MNHQVFLNPLILKKWADSACQKLMFPSCLELMQRHHVFLLSDSVFMPSSSKVSVAEIKVNYKPTSDDPDLMREKD
jgi:hypothetical protein